MPARARVPALAVLLALAFLSSGCLVTTLQPIYDDESLQVDETLTGTWQGQEQGATIVVERGAWKSYRVSYAARSTSFVFVGYLTAIGGFRFLDLTPEHGLEAGPLMIPAHGICRLHHDGDRLSVEVFDYDWFTSAVRAKKLAGLDTAVDGRGNILLTSKTEVLRGWLEKNGATAEVFHEPVIFTRAR